MATDFGFLPATSGEHYFISYNTEDTDRVRPIAQALHRAGVPLWYDYGLEYGKEWERQIAISIHSAKAVIMFVTDAVFRKERSYVRKEYDIAEAYQVPVIPVVLENVESSSLPEHSIGWWMDVRALHSVQRSLGDNTEALLSKIIHALGLSSVIVSNYDRIFAPVASPENSPESTPALESMPAPAMRAKEMNEAGDDFYFGRNGKPQNFSEAVKWYRKAAELGYAEAQNNLGICYRNGRGAVRDYAEAVKWYREAADRGNARAQNNLGICYESGYGVVRDYGEAVKWYRKAAEQGLAEAQYNLGDCFEFGKGVARVRSEALRWYSKAAEQNFEKAISALKRLENKGQ